MENSNSSNYSKVYILCVDDDRTVLNSLRHELFEGLKRIYKIEIADSGEEGLDILNELLEQKFIVPVIISDQLMPGMKGDEFLAQAHAICPTTRKILLTGQATTESVAKVINSCGLYRFIAKPWNKEDLVLTVEQAIKSYFTDLQLANSIKNIQLLNEYATVLGKEVSLMGWINTFIHKVLQDTHTSRALLIIHLDAAQTYYVHGWMNERKEVLIEEVEPFQLDEFYPVQVITETLRESKKYVHNWNTDTHFAEFHSFYCAPFIKEGYTLGCLYLESGEEEYFFEEPVIEFLDSLVNQAVITLENAILYQNLEQKVKERTLTIEQQKKEIEAKNKDITDSIQYARRIQYAILPNQEILSSLFPNFFIFYLPKDIVSGDFYWFTQINNCFYIAAVDCTGHGVPGAFMAVLSHSLLNQIVIEKKIDEPQEVLTILDKSIFQLLQSEIDTIEPNMDNTNNIADGMEIAFCKIDLSNYLLTFSGANRPCWITRNNQLFELKQDKKSIGGLKWCAIDAAFSSKMWKLEKGDRIYLFTDGITDQFGGEKLKRYTRTRFEKWILNHQDCSLQEQGKLLIEEFNDWRRGVEQLDDILVLGFEYTFEYTLS
ncbi:MAG: SpoIIE family protein phosphatase [Bacteroidia bacterium]|nr:SpoIIE family protein phosphatase [Bacteroidia bacterium]MDW8158658.1 SpoIIE family protein phosphatase [Bacteroidia bacterium]